MIPMTNEIRTAIAQLKMDMPNASNAEVAVRFEVSEAQISRWMKGAGRDIRADTWKRMRPYLSKYINEKKLVMHESGPVYLADSPTLDDVFSPIYADAFDLVANHFRHLDSPRAIEDLRKAAEKHGYKFSFCPPERNIVGYKIKGSPIGFGLPQKAQENSKD